MVLLQFFPFMKDSGLPCLLGSFPAVQKSRWRLRVAELFFPVGTRAQNKGGRPAPGAALCTECARSSQRPRPAPSFSSLSLAEPTALPVKRGDQAKGPAPCCALSSSSEHRARGAGICLRSALQPQKTEIPPTKAYLGDTSGLAPDHGNRVSQNLFAGGGSCL